MPTSSSYRGSTQDGSSGVQVAQATSEVSGSGTLVCGVQEGNKSTYADQDRTGVTTADTSTTDLSTSGFAGSSGANLLDLGNALAIEITGSCSTASATATGRLIFYDGSNAPIGMSELITLAADANRRIAAASDYLCPRVMVDAGQARKARFYIETISAGTWAISVRPI